MKKILLITLLFISGLFMLTSCISAQTYRYSYDPYDVEHNLVVMNNVCYVYYTNPTTLFLNSLRIVDGAYYYRHNNHYIPVVFPNWAIWSPHRFFYYEKNKWMWRNRFNYNHNEYRRTHHWIDYRKPNRHQNYKPNHQRPHNLNNRPSHNKPNYQVKPHRGGRR